jgi:hypothetical protein
MTKQDVHTGKDIGYSTRKLKLLLPELVVERDNGYKQLNTKLVLHYLLKVIKVIKQIDNQQEQIDNQQEQINELKTLIKTKKMGLK